MRTLHLLRKLNPAEWGGTETALQRLFDGLQEQGVRAVAYCPRLEDPIPLDPPPGWSCEIRRFRAMVPIFGLSRRRRRQLVSVGGNLMSFDLLASLWRDRPAELIHTHALGRIGGIARTVARHRHLPFVVSIHGGALDLPRTVCENIGEPATGWEWGKLFGWLLQSRHLFRDADAIITCNPTEAALLRTAFPGRRVVVQPHAVPLAQYRTDHREAARAAFPILRGREILLGVGRIDPIKNQRWLLDQAPPIFERHPRALLVLAGPCTDETYGEMIDRKIRSLGLEHRVLLTGGFPPTDPRLIGLFQEAKAVLLPSVSETFGLVILEAWAAGTPVLSSRTSGATALVDHGRTGWLFDLGRPQEFHDALDRALNDPGLAREMAARGAAVSARHSLEGVAGQLRALYEQLIEEKQCAT